MLPDHIIIDFDSTFITVESLDKLAAYKFSNNANGKNLIKDIQFLTNAGMNGDITFKESLDKRMKLLDINQNDILVLIEKLADCITPSFQKNKLFFKENFQRILIFSGGFKEFIIPIVDKFGINKSQVFANEFIYNSFGDIIGIDQKNVMSSNKGKVKQARSLKLNGEIHVIGDGFTDYEIKSEGVATHFFAFTENIKRKNVCELSDQVLSKFDDYLLFII